MNVWEKGDNNPTALTTIDMDYDKNASCRDNGNEQRVQEVLLYYAHNYEA